MALHDKLVRDKVPDIIGAAGGSVKIHVAEYDEFEEKLFDKLREEVMEFKNTKSVENLTDILEVLDAVTHLYQWQEADVAALKAKKLEERGGFTKKLILDEVSDNA